jgi:hypothetical protein
LHREIIAQAGDAVCFAAGIAQRPDV